jgi:hypothetical protein
MSRRRNRAVLLAAALSLALPLGSASGQAKPQGQAQSPSGAARAKAPAKEEQAMAALKEMSATLAAAKTMRFKVHSFIPVKLASGAWITLIGGATVMREAKDRLFVETSGDVFPFRYYYDGKTVTAFAPKEKIYAQRDAEGTIDEVLARAAKNGEAAFVFGDLVSSDPYAAMTKDLEGAFVVGVSLIDGTETEHVAAHGKALDWEIWIGMKDRLPRMVTLTDLRDARKPTHTVQLSDWELGPTLPGDTFTFAAPAEATKVPFRDPRQLAAAARKATPAKKP